MAILEIKVPDIGDVTDVAVIELLVKVGDRVALEQSLITVESDKASMEIPSSAAGLVKEIKVALGDKVTQGSLVLLLETEAAAPASVAATPAVAAAVAAPPPVAATAVGGTRTVEVFVPDIGDFESVSVIEVFVKVGDSIRVEQSLITVESDKASMEIPSSTAGVIKELKVALGDKVAKGSLLALVEVAAPVAQAAAAAAPALIAATVALAPAPVPVRAAPTASLPAHEPMAAKARLPHASPSIRRIARELGVPLDEIKGTGPNGRIQELDLQGFVKSVLAGAVQTLAQKAAAPAAAAPAAAGNFPGLLPWPKVDFEKFGPVERRDLSRIKKISGANLHRNWVLIPHVTNNDDADITDLEAFRVQLNGDKSSPSKVTMLAFMIKAAVAALKKFPEFNASLDGEQLVLKNYFHIGFAADTPNGLMVPVLRDADKKGIFQISQEMGELAKKARDGKLGTAEMTGGCFSISSLGGIGGGYFTPIINAPEVAIMGVGKSRVIDGASAARFNAYFASLLADFRRIAL